MVRIVQYGRSSGDFSPPVPWSLSGSSLPAAPATGTAVAVTGIRLSTIRDEMWDLAERDPLTDEEERRWQQLVPHWLALADRVLEDTN